jgi:hypothetical protein
MEEQLTESQVQKTFEVVKEFTKSDGQVIVVGAETPAFVFEKDFSKKDWKRAIKEGAFVPAAEKEPLKKDETVVFEKISDEPVVKVVLRKLPRKEKE